MELVPEGKQKAVLEKYSLTALDQLPHMKKNDPAAVALGAKEGDVIKIDRQEPTGKCTYYRVVVA
jgi:DNA-directed RNA polymerase subunit H (RpoH/RPB5)